MPSTTSVPCSSPTGFPRLDAAMAQARAVYTADPSRVSSIRADALTALPRSLPPPPEEVEFSERVDRALVHSMSMLELAEEQLAAPISKYLPSELTASEVADRHAEKAWNQKYASVDDYTDRMLAKSQDLFADVMLLIDEHEQNDLPLPDNSELPTPPPSPLLMQLNVPGGVKSWIASSQKSSRASKRKANSSLARSRSVKISSLLAHFEEPGPRQTTSLPASPGATAPTCREQLAPCRAAIINHAGETRMPGAACSPDGDQGGEGQRGKSRWLTVWRVDTQLNW